MKKRILQCLAMTTLCLPFLASAATNKQSVRSLLEGKDNLIHVAILGSGPAGYAAAIPTARYGYHTVIFQGPKPGGELTDSPLIENWPAVTKDTGFTNMEKIEKQAVHFGAIVDPNSITDIDFAQWPFKLTTSEGKTVYACTIIIATGASQKKMNIENEDIYYNKGLFSCGICDAHFTKDKDSIVIGGGDIAIQRVIQIAPQAKSVTIIISGPHLTATESMKEKLCDFPHVSIKTHKEVKKIVGDGKKIDHVDLVDARTRKRETFPTQCIFLSTGLTANTEIFKNKIALDQFGCIKLKPGRSQEVEGLDGVMAAGTVADPLYRQIGTVIGDGTRAAIDAQRYLSNKRGIEGELKKAFKEKFYIPTILNHPIKHIKSICEFDRTIADESLPILVEFYSPKCSHCKKMEAPLAIVSEKHKDSLKVFKVNKDPKTNREQLLKLVQMKKISMIPAFILYNKGKEVRRMEGETTQERLLDFIERGLNPEKP